MDQAYKCYCKSRGDSRKSQVVEDAVQRQKEDAQLRLARIANNAEPSHKNGHPKAVEKGA
jgi:hypothetical protein